MFHRPGSDEAGPAVHALTDAANIVVDLSTGTVQTITLGGNRTMGNPTNGVAGQTYIFLVTQDPTGDRWLEWGSAYNGKPEIKRHAAECTVCQFVYDGTNMNFVGDGAVWIPCTQDTSDSTLATYTTVTGMSFTPVPNAVYRLVAIAAFTAAAATTGASIRIQPGGCVGQSISLSRGAAINVGAAYYPSFGLANVSAGTSSEGATVGSPYWMEATILAPANPTAISMEFTTEVDGSNVTIKADLSGFMITRLK